MLLASLPRLAQIRPLAAGEVLFCPPGGYQPVMLQLTADEARVLGVLIEKSTTTPEQYPLSLNAITLGSNQKNNRDPVRTMSDDECFDAVESLRGKGLAVRVDQIGGRVHKFRHEARDVLKLRPAELAIMAELLLRGPQTAGELRTRASRMAPLESLELTQSYLATLMQRDEPLVKQLPPTPGTRAVRYQQLMAPEETSGASAGDSAEMAPAGAVQPAEIVTSVWEDRLSRLEAEVASLRAELFRLREALGEK
jgi:uncharacterized protein YceH (UPF0502 family)